MVGRGLRLALIGLVTAGVVAPLLANSIIISSQIDRKDAILSVGSRLPDGTSIVLRGGEVIRLLDKTGTRTLRGPGQFRTGPSVVENSRVGTVVDRFTDQRRTARPAALGSGPMAKPRPKAMASRLLQNLGGRRTRTGAVRGGTEQTPLWTMMQSGQSGNFCFTGGQRLKILRKMVSGLLEDFSLTEDSTGANIGLTEVIGVPIAYPYPSFWPTDASKLTLTDPIGGTTTNITLRQISTGETDPVSVYTALDALGCIAQRDQFIASIAQKSEEP